MDECHGLTFWHGGKEGRKRGEFLLPPALTKVQSLSEYGAAGVHRTDRVYLVTRPEAAIIYAAGWPNGMLYEVEPIVFLEADPDCTMTGLSWQCEKARVLKLVRLSEDIRRMVRARIAPNLRNSMIFHR